MFARLFPYKLFLRSSFREMGRNTYSLEVQAEHKVVSVSVPENVTVDVAGNRNLASNVLQVWHCKHSNTQVSFAFIHLFISIVI